MPEEIIIRTLKAGKATALNDYIKRREEEILLVYMLDVALLWGMGPHYNIRLKKKYRGGHVFDVG